MGKGHVVRLYRYLSHQFFWYKGINISWLNTSVIWENYSGPRHFKYKWWLFLYMCPDYLLINTYMWTVTAFDELSDAFLWICCNSWFYCISASKVLIVPLLNSNRQATAVIWMKWNLEHHILGTVYKEGGGALASGEVGFSPTSLWESCDSSCCLNYSTERFLPGNNRVPSPVATR